MTHEPGGLGQITFQVDALFGLSRDSVPLPVGQGRTVDSGQVCITIDPHAHPSANLGLLDFRKPSLVVRYGIQAVFPGLWELHEAGEIDRELLNPVRATATDQCTLAGDGTGWRADGCLEFLPGSFWAGTDGG